MPETGSLRDRITTSTRCAVASLKARSFLHQRERDAGLGGRVDALELQPHVGAVVVGLEVLVLFLEVEQRPRGDRDDELTGERSSHRAIIRVATDRDAEGVRPSLSEGGSEAGREQPVSAS